MRACVRSGSDVVVPMAKAEQLCARDAAFHQDARCISDVCPFAARDGGRRCNCFDARHSRDLKNVRAILEVIVCSDW